MKKETEQYIDTIVEVVVDTLNKPETGIIDLSDMVADLSPNEKTSLLNKLVATKSVFVKSDEERTIAVDENTKRQMDNRR